jgi:hypothetical protein
MGNLWKMLKDATAKYGGVVIGAAVAAERYLFNQELNQKQEEIKESNRANLEASRANKILSEQNLEASKSNLERSHSI